MRHPKTVSTESVVRYQVTGEKQHINFANKALCGVDLPALIDHHGLAFFDCLNHRQVPDHIVCDDCKEMLRQQNYADRECRHGAPSSLCPYCGDIEEL